MDSARQAAVLDRYTGHKYNQTRIRDFEGRGFKAYSGCTLTWRWGLLLQVRNR